MNKIPKVLHYVWFWKGEKPKSFLQYLNSWKKYCPDYEIIEWDEANFDIKQNKYCKKFYDKKLWAFASDYARIKILYDNWWIYLDTDIEILKNFDDLLDSEWFLSFQDIFSVGWSIIWAQKWNKILAEILEIYNKQKTRIIITNLLTKVFKKHWLVKYNNKIQDLNNFKIYTKDYFYPYAYFEKPENMVITKNTFTIHHYDATWLPKFIIYLIFPIIWFFNKNNFKICNKKFYK